MAIDKDQLISLLVEKTGSEPEEVGRQLSQLIYRIRNAAGEGKSFEIEGLGTFSLKNDQLQFAPDDVLETEINNKYTGMKPIELIGAFKGADVDAGNVEITEESPLPVEEPKTDAEIEKERWTFDETSADEQARIEKAVFGKTFDDAGDEMPEPPPKTPETAEVPELPKEPVIRKKESAAKPDEDPIGKVLTIAAIILLVGVAGWLLYDFVFQNNYTTGDQSSLQPRTVTSISSPREVPISTVDATGKQTSGEVTEPASPAGVTTDDDEAFSAPQNRYGLIGEVNKAVSTGYTIVVHSLNLEKARAIQEQLQTDGFRVMIMKAVVSGDTYYRVGLGQFPSVEAAQQAISQLPEKFQNHNFIKRF